MVAHLRTRRLVVYVPWILSQPAAEHLAEVLYLQYAAGVAQASITIPADPLIEVGSLVDVEVTGAGGGAELSRYYVSSILAQLTWGGAWVYTLTLAYGRAPNEPFPYTGKVQWPAVTAAMRAGLPQPTAVTSWDPGNPYWDNTPYTIVAQAGLAKDQAATEAYPVGSVIFLNTQPHSKGRLIGPAPLGEYTVVARSNPALSATTIALQSTTAATGYITIKEIATTTQAEGAAGAGPGVSIYSATTLPNSAADAGASGGTRSTASTFIGPVGGKPQLNALTAAAAHVNDLYKFDHAGPDGWDCSGVVAAGFADAGMPQLISIGGGGGGAWNTDAGPNGIYDFFARNGATMIDPSQAQAGDLLFWQDNSGSGYWNGQNGFRHVGFCSGPKETFQALGPENTRSIGYYPFSAAPFNLALRMSTVTWGHLS